MLVADTTGSHVKEHTTTAPLALILSKESQGVREEAKKLFQTVTIPMDGRSESLNVASAGAILLYELKDA